MTEKLATWPEPPWLNDTCLCSMTRNITLGMSRYSRLSEIPELLHW